VNIQLRKISCVSKYFIYRNVTKNITRKYYKLFVFFCGVILDVIVYRDDSESQRLQVELSEAQSETANLRQKVKVYW